MHIANLNEIKGALAGRNLLPALEAGFVAYAQGRANVPPVAELLMYNRGATPCLTPRL